MHTGKQTYSVRLGRRAIGMFTGMLVSGCLALSVASAPAGAQQVGAPLGAPPADPAIASAISQVSTDQIRGIITSLVDFHTRNTLSSMTADLPPGTGVTPAAKWIEQRFQQISVACHDCLEVKSDTYTEPADDGPRSRIKVPTTLTNVYAVLRGSDPAQASRMYLVTGHYDSRASDVMDPRALAPGANDDASGVAVSLECARVLSQHRWPATIVFVAVAGEEQGLNGSKHLATVAKEQGWQLAGVLNDDIVGGDTTPGDTMQDKTRVRVFSQGISTTATPEEIHRTLTLGLESDGPSRELARVITEVGRTYLQPSSLQPVMEFRLDRYLRGGDHSSFNQLGFAAVRFTEWRENFDHQHQNVRTESGKQYGDLLQYVDFDYVAKVARLNAATLATLASAPAAPTDVRIVTTDLDNNSTLHWAPAPRMPVSSHFDIVWRDTSAPDWQFHQAVPGGAAMDASILQPLVTLPVSKDNVIFGVRACNQAGECSAAVVPLPGR
jgi:hypothetical protein